jgi:Xaa-Pro dipeptidase
LPAGADAAAAPAERPAAELPARLERLRASLAGAGLDAALLLWTTDVFYFAGTRQSAALWVPVAGQPTLLCRKSLARARAESPLADIRPFPPSRQLASAFPPARRVGMTLDVVPVALHQLWSRALPGAEIVDLSPAVRWLRSAKSPWEQGRMRACGALLGGVMAELPSFLRAGMRELDLAAEVEVRLRRAGSECGPRVRAFSQEVYGGVALAGTSAEAQTFFDGAVTGGGLSPTSPLGASRAPIPPDAPVVVDYTAALDGYFVDMTRIAVCGRLGPELRRAFEVALAVQEEVAEGLRPGAVPSRLYAGALERADAAGLAGAFMGPPGAQVRFVGHGVGLELDELPVLAPGFDEPLQAGQTLAVEPKFVLPGLGAVGIENTWAVAEGGGQRLTAAGDDLVEV